MQSLSSIIALDPTTYATIDGFLECKDEAKRKGLIEQWRKHTLSEMEFVGLIVRPLLRGNMPKLLLSRMVILTCLVRYHRLVYGLNWLLANSPSLRRSTPMAVPHVSNFRYYLLYGICAVCYKRNHLPTPHSRIPRSLPVHPPLSRPGCTGSKQTAKNMGIHVAATSNLLSRCGYVQCFRNVHTCLERRTRL